MADPRRFDSPPASEEEREALLREVARQSLELVPVPLSVAVTCPCGRTEALVLACRCHHCGIFFCRRCSDRHFGPAPRAGMEVERG